MAAPPTSSARRPAVGYTLSESFAVIAHRKHTLTVRNGAKFRGVFSICACQTLFSRQTFLAIRPPFGSMARFWGDDRPHDGIGMVWNSPLAQPMERPRKPFVVSGTPNGKPFMAKWQTFRAKHRLQSVRIITRPMRTLLTGEKMRPANQVGADLHLLQMALAEDSLGGPPGIPHL